MAKKKLSHEREVDSLIPKAIKAADRKLKKLPNKHEKRTGSDGTPYKHCFWTEFYHEAMNRLTRKAGLRA